MIDPSSIKVGDRVWFGNPQQDGCGWANNGYVNDKPMWPYIPVWTERQKGEATTLMVHVSNIDKIGD